MCSALASSLKIGHPLRNPVRSRSPRSSRHGTPLRPCAIGFDLPGSSPSKSPERSADELSRAASSLLLYQSVLKHRPAHAFLDVLLHLQKGSPLKLTEHYGELYKGLAADGWASWQDFLVDHALRAVDNPFAKAAARGEPSDHFLPAVRHDLNAIQSLAVTEATLAGWVQETVNGLPETWALAATTLTPPLNVTGSTSGGEDISLVLPSEPPLHIRAPLTIEQRAILRSELCQKWQWGEGAELLQQYHAVHDYGIVSMHKVLKWGGDRLQAQDVLEGVVLSSSGLEGAASRTVAAALEVGLLKVNLGDRRVGAEPIILTGCARTAYSTAALALRDLENIVEKGLREQAAGVRTVILPQSSLKTISELAWTLSQHPRVRFAVLCPGLPKDLDADIAATIAGGDGVGWPSNAVFIACCDTGPAPSKLPGIRIDCS